MVQNVYALKFDTLNKLHQAIRFLKVNNQYDYKELIGYNTIYVLDIKSYMHFSTLFPISVYYLSVVFVN